MSTYISGLEKIASLKRTAKRGAEILGEAAQAVAPRSSVTEFLTDIKATAPTDVKDGALTLVGAAAGGYLYKKHRVLGVLGGASLGRNVPALLQPWQRRNALVNMGITAAGILGSLAYKRHPAVGFGLGWLAGGAAAYVTKVRG